MAPAVVAALPPSVLVVAVVRRFDGVVVQEDVVGDGRRGWVQLDPGPVAPDPPAGDDESVHGCMVGPDQDPAISFPVQDGRIGLNVPVPGIRIIASVQVDPPDSRMIRGPGVGARRRQRSRPRPTVSRVRRASRMDFPKVAKGAAAAPSP